jgi:hypothetical protein
MSACLRSRHANRNRPSFSRIECVILSLCKYWLIHCLDSHNERYLHLSPSSPIHLLPQPIHPIFTSRHFRITIPSICPFQCLIDLSSFQHPAAEGFQVLQGTSAEHLAEVPEMTTIVIHQIQRVLRGARIIENVEEIAVAWKNSCEYAFMTAGPSKCKAEE